MNSEPLSDEDVDELLLAAAAVLFPPGDNSDAGRESIPWELHHLRRLPLEKVLNDREMHQWTVAILTMIRDSGRGVFQLSTGLYEEIFGISGDWTPHSNTSLSKVFNHLGLSGYVAFHCVPLVLTLTSQGIEVLRQHEAG